MALTKKLFPVPVSKDQINPGDLILRQDDDGAALMVAISKGEATTGLLLAYIDGDKPNEDPETPFVQGFDSGQSFKIEGAVVRPIFPLSVSNEERHGSLRYAKGRLGLFEMPSGIHGYRRYYDVETGEELERDIGGTYFHAWEIVIEDGESEWEIAQFGTAPAQD